MSRFHSYLSSAIKIISTNPVGYPLNLHIKSFLSAGKKYGSNDRRIITSLCYYYFRTGKAYPKCTIEEKIILGLFLCEHKTNDILQLFRPDLNEHITLNVEQKLLISGVTPHDIFPYSAELEKEINGDAFSLSMLLQPAVYLRIRPQMKKNVIKKLNVAGVAYELHGEECISITNHLEVKKIADINKEVVIQDMNSQRVLDFLGQGKEFLPGGREINAWDCCAASGGKSILLFDKLEGRVRLTVSDIRENILVNLNERLKQASVPVSKSFITDLSLSSGMSPEEKYHLIICDAPCSGSGTWARNPEQLFFFSKKLIGSYASRQQSIISHTIPQLKPDGLYFYITCSVFKAENENAVTFILKEPKMKLLSMEYLKGYDHRADTMFVAVFTLITF